jgi:iron(III) transport system permease protein
VILAKSVENRAGEFVGLANFEQYFQHAGAARSIWNSVWVSTLVTAITIPLAFTFAYALTRSCMPLQGAAAQHGAGADPRARRCSPRSRSSSGSATRAAEALHGRGQIYGAPGIVISMVFATFPHALMILVTALSLTDARLYEAADALGTAPLRKFCTITVPGAKYGSSARRWWCSPTRSRTSASRR